MKEAELFWFGSRFLRDLQHMCQIDFQCGSDTQQGFEGRIAHFTLNVAHHLLR